jgi:Cof subfamily protein (haloacid dehalogenase superfamily)
MSQISLIATDLDGTLLTSDGQIAPATCAAVQAAHSQGIPVILATTRNLPDVHRFCQTLAISDPIICTNGAQVLASPQGPQWAYHSIPQEVALKIARMADEQDWELSITVNSLTYLRQRPGQALGPLSDTLSIAASNVEGVVDDPIRIMAWDPVAIEALRRHCETKLSGLCYAQTYYKPSGVIHSLGIFAQGADKRSALSVVLTKLGIVLDNVLAIGDNDNDLPLFCLAGLKVAIGNATQSLKEQADIIAPSNDENGVAWAIEHFVLK